MMAVFLSLCSTLKSREKDIPFQLFKPLVISFWIYSHSIKLWHELHSQVVVVGAVKKTILGRRRRCKTRRVATLLVRDLLEYYDSAWLIMMIH